MGAGDGEIFTSGSTRRMRRLGGTACCCRASTQTRASMAPAAAMAWPKKPLVEDTAG